MLLLIGAVIFANLLVICVLVYRYLSRQEQAVNQRMGQYVEQMSLAESGKVSLLLTGTASELTGWRALVRKLSRFFEAPDGSWSRGVEHKLIQAGLPLRSSEFMVIRLTVATAGAILLLLVNGSLAGFAIGGICGYYLPFVVLKIKIKRRAKAFNSQLGDTLILIANSLRTGYSFMQAIEMVAREMLPPISVEFGRTLKEMNLGVPTEEAMNNMAKRVDSDDLDLVITAVLIQRQVGGNLAEVLDNIAGTIRERVRIKGEIKTLTAQGRVSGIIISLLPIAIMAAMQVINPGYISTLFTHPAGQAMLAVSAVNMVIGVLVIQKIVNIEV